MVLQVPRWLATFRYLELSAMQLFLSNHSNVKRVGNFEYMVSKTSGDVTFSSNGVIFGSLHKEPPLRGRKTLLKGILPFVLCFMLESAGLLHSNSLKKL